jgi:hypothetical protein
MIMEKMKRTIAWVIYLATMLLIGFMWVSIQIGLGFAMRALSRYTYDPAAYIFMAVLGLVMLGLCVPPFLWAKKVLKR